MNLENLPGQLLALMLGWSFTVFIQNRSNRRAEALKRKDKIIDKLEELSGWVESEVAKDNFSSNQTETTYSGMISQIEVKLAQLNKHVGRDVFDVSLLSKLRQVEIFDSVDDNLLTPYKIREAASDIVEEVEVCCDKEYFARKGLLASLNDYFYHFQGFVIFLVCFFVVFAIYQFHIRYVAQLTGGAVIQAEVPAPSLTERLPTCPPQQREAP